MPALIPITTAEEALAAVATATDFVGVAGNPAIKVVSHTGSPPGPYEVTLSVHRLRRELVDENAASGASRYRNYFVVLLFAKVSDVSSDELWGIMERVRQQMSQRRIQLLEDEYMDDNDADSPRHGIAAGFHTLG